MDKKALRAEIRRQKAAMTPAQIQGCSRELTRMALASPLYEAARSIYGYLPYNQEVHTLELLQAALNSGKRVAVPKVFVLSGSPICKTSPPGTAAFRNLWQTVRRRTIPTPWS